MNKKQIEQVSLVLNHRNWTGLTLRELVDAGRIQANDQKVIREFTKAALGEPRDMGEWHDQKETSALVILALQGFAMERSVA